MNHEQKVFSTADQSQAAADQFVWALEATP